MHRSPGSSHIIGYDVARAMAVFGMVVVDFTSMMEVSVFSPPWLKPFIDLIYGRAAAVFVMLAGVSVSLMAARDPAPAAILVLRKRLLKRSLLLLISGMLLWHWWDADILHFYAVFIAMGSLAASWSRPRLRAWTAAVLLISLPVCAAMTAAHDLGDVVAFVDRQTYVIRLLLDYATSSNYAVFPWLVFFMGGMLLGRREPADSSFWRFAGLLGLLGLLMAEIASSVSMAWVERHGWEVEGNAWVAFLRSEAFPVTPLFVLSAGASGLALIALCRTLFAGAIGTGVVGNALAAFGRISLTLYVAHIGWGMLFKHWMKDPGTGLNSSQVFLAVGIFCSAGILLAVMWSRYFRRGPLEALFHRFSKVTPLPVRN